jgi:hypothetical protein
MRLLRVTCAVVTALAMLPVAGAAVASAWWTPVGLRGIALTAVAAAGDTITVRTAAGVTVRSGDGGVTFTAAAPPLPPDLPGVAVSGRDTWSIDASGHVLRSQAGGAAERDPGAPLLGRGARLIAAPAGAPGVVVAASVDGTVWRRGQDGDWKTALLLLPTGLPGRIPAVTALTAFAQPLTEAVYLGTDGYSVLVSTDGGDDWIRAGPGLPESVRGLAADAARRSVYAATSDGLWVHRVQAFPAPPVYRDAALAWRWAGIALVALLAAIVTTFAMLRVVARS